MNNSLLIGQSGAGEPSPFEAGIADIDDQNHAYFFASSVVEHGAKRARIASWEGILPA
jgi:hypothetical protein